MEGPCRDPNFALLLSKQPSSELPLKKRQQYLAEVNDTLIKNFLASQQSSSSTDSNLNETAMPYDLASNLDDNGITNESFVPNSEPDNVSTEKVTCTL
jgi:hypothetical protein